MKTIPEIKPARLDKDSLLVDLDRVIPHLMMDNCCPFAKGNHRSEWCSIAHRESRTGSWKELRCPDRSVDHDNVSAPSDCPLRQHAEISVRPAKTFMPGDTVRWGNNREGVIIQRNPNKGTLLVRYQPGGGVHETKVLIHEREAKYKGKG
jgi:hypothetical protein